MKKTSALLRKVFLYLVIALALIFLVLLIRGEEDTWICSGGQWVRHGVPNTAMPDEPCP